MSNSSLVCYTKLSPNYSVVKNKKNKKITVHHLAGNCSVETVGDIFYPTDRRASCNYAIGSDGRIGMYVEEHHRSWCTSSRENDSQAVTIEVANCTKGPEWKVTETAFSALVDLCEDICRRNGIEKLNYTGDKSGNLTKHEWFANTTCPGPYLGGRFQELADKVNMRLSGDDCDKIVNEKLYRVRKTWDDAKSQAGAYTSLVNAKKKADEKSGYYVFDESGKVVYPDTVRDESVPVNGFYRVTKGRSVQLSKNFNSSEFECNGKGCCTETPIDVKLVECLQKIRDHFDKPVKLTNSYRCPTHNSKVPNASKKSKHMNGSAADIYIVGVKPLEIAKYAESIGILGIGLYDTDSDGHFVHIDTRTSKSFWFGQKQSYRSTFGGVKEDAVLRIGDKNDLVKQLQKDLIELNYDLGKSGVDGSFGAKTQEAVKKFQKDCSLTVNGVVDDTVQNALDVALGAKRDDSDYGVDDFIADVQESLNLGITGVATQSLLNKTITVSSKNNNKHKVVVPIQKRLYAMGYTEVGNADGSAGPKFTQAVKNLQKKSGKTVDGEITAKQYTWKILLGLVK